MAKSISTMRTIVRKTAKSLIIDRTFKKENRTSQDVQNVVLHTCARLQYVSFYPCWKISAGFELLEEGGQEEGGEKQDGRPEKYIGSVGAVMTTRCPDKLTMQV